MHFNHYDYVDLASTDGDVPVTIGTRRSLYVDPVRQEVLASLTDEYLEFSVDGGPVFRFPAWDVAQLAEAMQAAYVAWQGLRDLDRSPAEVTG